MCTSGLTPPLRRRRLVVKGGSVSGHVRATRRLVSAGLILAGASMVVGSTSASAVRTSARERCCFAVTATVQGELHVRYTERNGYVGQQDFAWSGAVRALGTYQESADAEPSFYLVGENDL